MQHTAHAALILEGERQRMPSPHQHVLRHAAAQVAHASQHDESVQDALKEGALI
jgi:hypothetical protein